MSDETDNHHLHAHDKLNKLERSKSALPLITTKLEQIPPSDD